MIKHFLTNLLSKFFSSNVNLETGVLFSFILLPDIFHSDFWLSFNLFSIAHISFYFQLWNAWNSSWSVSFQREETRFFPNFIRRGNDRTNRKGWSASHLEKEEISQSTETRVDAWSGFCQESLVGCFISF